MRIISYESVQHFCSTEIPVLPVQNIRVVLNTISSHLCWIFQPHTSISDRFEHNQPTQHADYRRKQNQFNKELSQLTSWSPEQIDGQVFDIDKYTGKCSTHFINFSQTLIVGQCSIIWTEKLVIQTETSLVNWWFTLQQLVCSFLLNW